MSVTASIVAGVGSALSSGLGYAVSSNGKKKSIRRAERANRALMDYQNDINVRNWQMENEYNSPAAQMERYRDAGLNPNLIYNQQNTSGDVGSVGASMSPVSADADFSSSVPNSIDAYQRISQTEQYNETEQMRRKVMQSEVEKNAAQTVNQLLSNEKVTTERPYWSQNAKYQSDILVKQSEQMNLENKQRMWQLLTGNTLQEAHINAQIESLRAQRDNIIMNTRMDEQHKNRLVLMLDKQIAWADALSSSTVELQKSQRKLNQRELYESRGTWKDRLRLLNYQADMAGIDYDWNVADRTLQRIQQGMNEALRVGTPVGLFSFTRDYPSKRSDNYQSKYFGSFKK